jgi:CHAD domain-containing protein
MMPHSPTQLGEHISTLRHALRDVQHNPAPDPVHDLRSTIRRIEAVLQSEPDHSEQFLKTTKPIRKSSGLLRDLDIQIDLLTQLSETQNQRAAIHHDVQQLTRLLHKERDPQATNLQRKLGKHHAELRDLLDTMANLEPTPLDQPGRLAHRLFTESTAALDPRDPLQLHAIRKAARISRYLAETGPTGPNSVTARHFHHIHQVMGTWHDWLTLSETARDHLASGSPLLLLLERNQNRAHTATLKLLGPKISSTREDFAMLKAAMA